MRDQRGRAPSCWGRNYEGQLGNGQASKTKPVNYSTPQQVSKQFNGIRALDLGYSETLAADAAGELYAFGDLSPGARGLTPAPDSTPRRVALPAPVLEVRANDGHRCVLPLTTASGAGEMVTSTRSETAVTRARRTPCVSSSRSESDYGRPRAPAPTPSKPICFAA